MNLYEKSMQILDGYKFPKGLFDSYHFFQKGRKSIQIIPKPQNYIASSYHQGMPLVRVDSKFPKISSMAAVSFGHLATMQYVELSEDQVHDFLLRKVLILDEQQLMHAIPNSFVIVRLDGCGIGVGFTDDTNQLASLVPKVWGSMTKDGWMNKPS